MRGRLGAIVAAAVASCATSVAPRSTGPALGPPLFPAGAVDPSHELASAAPPSSSDAVSGDSPSVPPSAPVPPSHDLIRICSRDTNAGSALCEALTGGDDHDCIKVCFDEYAAAHAKPPPAPPGLPGATSIPRAAAASTPSPAPPPPPPPDPYAFVLRNCILRVRDSGGSEPPVCHFDPPLDAMGFGQRHCDAKCAALTEAYRGPGSGRPPGGE